MNLARYLIGHFKGPKTHVHEVNIPEHNGEIGSMLGGRKNPEYRFGGPGMLIFEGKRHKKTFFVF